MRRFASFPWYDLPEMHATNDALWQALARELRQRGLDGVPAALDRRTSHPSAPDAGHLFTQTCGYPLLTTARGRFTPLGAPRYTVPGCSGSMHRSFIVVRAAAGVREIEGLRGARFAINEADSNSGMNLPRRLFAPLARDGRFFGATVLTGSHAASAQFVAAGHADAAALDCITFALLERHRPMLTRALRVIAQTPASPVPPLVTSRATDPATIALLRSALHRIAADGEYAALRAALCWGGIDPLDEADYAVILDYEREARQLGYAELR